MLVGLTSIGSVAQTVASSPSATAKLLSVSGGATCARDAAGRRASVAAATTATATAVTPAAAANRRDTALLRWVIELLRVSRRISARGTRAFATAKEWL